jgi:hypothetical protein
VIIMAGFLKWDWPDDLHGWVHHKMVQKKKKSSLVHQKNGIEAGQHGRAKSGWTRRVMHEMSK